MRGAARSRGSQQKPSGQSLGSSREGCAESSVPREGDTSVDLSDEGIVVTLVKEGSADG